MTLSNNPAQKVPESVILTLSVAWVFKDKAQFCQGECHRVLVYSTLVLCIYANHVHVTLAFSK